jgi:Spy/CpxP family protein refolding chaperone
MRSKTTAVFLLVAIFLLGGVAGGMSDYMFRNYLRSNPQPRPRIAGAHDIAEEMAQGLNLDAKQKEQLRAIIQQSTEKYRALSQQFRPQYESIRAEANDAIRAILSPEQRKIFGETLDRMDSQHRGHTHDAPAPPPPARR